MFTRRGTVIHALTLLAVSIGLLAYAGVYTIPFTVVYIILTAMNMCTTREYLGKTDIRYRRALVYLPVLWNEDLHNERARLYRRVQRLDDFIDECNDLIDDLPEDNRRVVILQAEAKTAVLERERLRSDVLCLERIWREEGAERRYRSITGGR